MSNIDKNVPVKQTDKPGSMVALLADLHRRNVPPEKYNLYIYNYLMDKAKEKGIPFTGYFELTPLCNLDCRMCYVHLKKMPENSAHLVTLEKWKSVISQAHEMGMLNAVLTGGECLTYPYFEEIYMYMISMGIKVSVLTNGILLEGKILDLFKQYRPKQIYVSLYGSSDDAYERVTGSRQFQRVYHNIIEAAAAGLTVRISITANHDMFPDYQALIRTAEASGLDYHVNFDLMNPREETGRKAEALTTDQQIELLRFYHKIKGKTVPSENKSDGTEKEPFEIPYTEKEYRGVRCGAGRSTFSMRWDGNIYPCVSLNDLYQSVMTQDFCSAWEKLHQGTLNYRIPSECEECKFRNQCSACVARHKDAAETGHCDRRICERTKQLIKANVI